MIVSKNDNKDRFVFKGIVNPIMEATILSDVKDVKNNKVIAEGIFQKCDSANANGHSFPKSVLANAVNEIQSDIKERHFLSELDHPEDIQDVNRISTVMLKQVSHVITDLKMDGDYVVGRFETLDTPNGCILATLLREKCKVGVSIRAITDQDISYGFDDGVDKINDFVLIAYDAVSNPAYSDAYVHSIVSSCYKLPNSNLYRIKEDPRATDLITVSKSELTSLLEGFLRNSIHKLNKK